MEAKLKPCPFCQRDMRISSNRDWHHLTGEHDDNCPFEPDEDTMCVPATDEMRGWLVAAWNRRASIEQPTSEAIHIGYFSTEHNLFWKLDQLSPKHKMVTIGMLLHAYAMAAPPADPTDAQKIAVLREGLHELGWCAEFGALAKKVLDGPAVLTDHEIATEAESLMKQGMAAFEAVHPSAQVDNRTAFAEFVARHGIDSKDFGLVATAFQAGSAALQQPGLADKDSKDAERWRTVKALSAIYAGWWQVQIRPSKITATPRELDDLFEIDVDAFIAAAPSPQDKP